MSRNERMLHGCRALDLTNARAFLCGKMLADLGFDVIKVEPPGGDVSRDQGPFWHDIAGPDNSMYWAAYNTDKRGITLNLESAEGRALLLDLVRTADVVIESFGAGEMERLGLGYESLAAVKPGIVLTRVSPFGQTGPYAHYRACDLVIMGMAGHLLLTGDADRPPVNVGLPQACMQAGADAAVGSLIAYRHARRTGRGQQVDISMQHSAAWFLATTIPYWELSQRLSTRVGTLRSGGSSGVTQRQVWPCRDGFVFFFMLGGQQGAKTCRQLVRWMNEEGHGAADLDGFAWETFDMASATQELVDRLSAPIADFFETRTKKEVLAAAIGRGISVCPLFSMADLLDDPNLAARDFWKQLPHPRIGASLPMPRRYVTSSVADTDTAFAAPGVGQHNAEVYAELGVSAERLGALRQAGVL